jgi:hypothetical protein
MSGVIDAGIVHGGYGVGSNKAATTAPELCNINRQPFPIASE